VRCWSRRPATWAIGRWSTTATALRESRLCYVAQRYLRADTIAAANARIVAYHAKLALSQRWGGGEVASIDGLRFVVPRRTIHAGFSRRYFDRRRGVTALGTTADHYAGLRTIVIPGTQPDAPYALDALLDPQTSVRPREIMTDTAGYTDIMFALYRLLGSGVARAVLGRRRCGVPRADVVCYSRLMTHRSGRHGAPRTGPGGAVPSRPPASALRSPGRSSSSGGQNAAISAAIVSAYSSSLQSAC
jgi:hypothetical protein